MMAVGELVRVAIIVSDRTVQHLLGLTVIQCFFRGNRASSSSVSNRFQKHLVPPEHPSGFRELTTTRAPD